MLLFFSLHFSAHLRRCGPSLGFFVSFIYSRTQIMTNIMAKSVNFFDYLIPKSESVNIVIIIEIIKIREWFTRWR